MKSGRTKAATDIAAVLQRLRTETNGLSERAMSYQDQTIGQGEDCENRSN